MTRTNDEDLRALLREAHAADDTPTFASVLAGRPRRWRGPTAAVLAVAAAVVAIVLLNADAEPAPGSVEVAREAPTEGDVAGGSAPRLQSPGARRGDAERLDLASARLWIASLAPPAVPVTSFAETSARLGSAPPRPLTTYDALGRTDRSD